MADIRALTATLKSIVNTKSSSLQNSIRVACVIVPFVFAVAVTLNGLNTSLRVHRIPKGQLAADFRTLVEAVKFTFHFEDGFTPTPVTAGGLVCAAPVTSQTLGSNQPALFCMNTNQPVRS